MVFMRGSTKERLKKIEWLLKKNPNGLWIWKIARELGVKSGSVEWLLNNYLRDSIKRLEIISAKRTKRKMPYMVLIVWKK